ncbi:MAG: Na/Pi cotransporter family protein [Phycisphaeraceae bacterium]|nr:Na/Pi cotransporter family protein [Phycisphaeraceae bacterium]
MVVLFFQLFGGIGLFLLGMMLLTDGLRAFAGEALRSALIRFTGTPLKAFGSGALATVLVQSSSATTVTVIGFVSAGLLSFPHAIGVVMGASLGTTGTGWIVSVLGLKVNVGFYALPMIGLGAFIKLLAKGRWRSLGLAVAGFGLIFVGIQTLQDAMHSLSEHVDLSMLPDGAFVGHLLAMLLGIFMTVIMQSSSAAVATTLTALHTRTISFDLAASLVIGAAVGTTVTGALAAIGATVPAKRTALAHVIFNLATGLIAIALLPLLLGIIRSAQKHMALEPGAMSLAAFHTIFIAVGVAVFLPLVAPFARLIERILPDRGPLLTRHLDRSVLRSPPVALEAARRALCETGAECIAAIRGAAADPPVPSSPERQAALSEALAGIRDFLDQVPPLSDDVALSQRRIALMHALDHLLRLHSRLAPPSGTHKVLFMPRLNPALELCRLVLALAEASLRNEAPDDWLSRIEKASADLAALRRDDRSRLLAESAARTTSPEQTLQMLDAMRWLDRMSYHAWRISRYLGEDDHPRPENDSPPAHPDD